MIGLERMLHAQQKPEPQNSKHGLPALPVPPENGRAPRLIEPVQATNGKRYSSLRQARLLLRKMRQNPQRVHAFFTPI
ncbi:MAG: hypothetical protein WDN50_20245 [Bradyrhizobium sp.]